MTTGAAEWAMTRTVRLSRRFTVDMTAGPSGYVCEWWPETPGPTRPLTPEEIHRYRAARHELLTELCARLGGDILVIEA